MITKKNMIGISNKLLEKMTKFGVIVAIDDVFGFAKDGKIPWRCPEDVSYFKEMTKNSTVIMGKKTYDSIGRLLPDRNNIIMSRNVYDGLKTYTFETLPEALENVTFAWIIGGIEIIQSFQSLYGFDAISVSRVHGTYQCDQHFHLPVLANFDKIVIPISEDLDILYSSSYKILGVYDKSYLQVLKKLLERPLRQTRNGKTRSLFGQTIRFDDIDKHGFPILSSKKIYWEGIVEELLFFLSGQTDTKELEKRNVNIWKGNTSDEFLEKNNKSYEAGDMGPMYGFQLKHFGEEYEGCRRLYNGIDQIQKVVELLLTDPHSRRILMTTYNPAQAEEGVLYPCHGLVTQFYVDDNKISLSTYQRSADWFLGVPFNISSYALLLMIIVREVNKHEHAYIPGDIIFNFGDIHLYESHLTSALKQLRVTPPVNENASVIINESFDINDPWKSNAKDFTLVDYTPGPFISAKMMA